MTSPLSPTHDSTPATPGGESSYRLAELRAALKPFRLHWFPRLRSTNDHAAAMRRRGDLYAPAAVLAGRQTAGRGRGGNVWWSGPGCITVTFVLPIEAQLSPHQLPLIAGLAVRNAAAEVAGNDAVRLKWPNDLLFEGRKLAGLLCERVMKADLVGVGLNVNLDPASAPPGLRERVASLAQAAGRPLHMNQVLSAVADHLHRLWSRRAEYPFHLVLKEYDTHHALVGRQVSVTGGPGEVAVSGRCEGLDDMGRLLLRSRSSLQRVVSGNVQLL